jgi:hypothetical protein
LNIQTTIVASLFVCTPVSSVLAQHADLLLINDQNGNLITGQYDFDSGQVVNTDTRVYEGEFDDFGVSDEPGFNALSSSNIPNGYFALAGNADVGFSANAFGIDNGVSNLWFWDGAGAVDFGISNNLLTISKAPSNIFSTTLDGSASDANGFTIDTTSSDGFLHKHIDFALNDTGAGASGFYLWSMDFSVGDSSSESVYFVHGFGIHDEEAHEAAVGWVETNLVPAPAGVLTLIGLPILTSRRRR